MGREDTKIAGGVEPPASVLQKAFQYGFRINGLRVVLVPIIFLGDLCVQDGLILADELALFLSDLHHLVNFASALGVVENIKVHTVSFPLGFCHNAVFLFAAGTDTNIVLRHPPQHIHTFANVDDFIVNSDTIDARMGELISEPLPLHPLVGVLLVGCH